ncbi:DUF433 domain-containing protein [Halosimplex pelagicum]|uniref:DUF433 domain-containing protein n=1 Tax=Halosimplex pelagicum TaxID=869886 RepID=A0A7D5P8N6_9EURY|nr:DUF433 domain-containing protein [Halosimplex pelagicum]QLH80545.1 DUF433 domain-containing protein [Halosimplex pelagicum]
MATEQVSGIVPGEDSEIHDEPHVEGSRLTVRFLREQVEARGLSPASVADRYDLPLADVYAALTYYHRNPDEMDTVEKRHEERIAEAEDRTTLRPPDE